MRTALQHGDCRYAKQGAVNRSCAAKNARAAEHHGGDGKKFVARACVCFCLAEARRIEAANALSDIVLNIEGNDGVWRAFDTSIRPYSRMQAA